MSSCPEWKEIPDVVVDFDGVIHSFHDGWGDGTIYGEPIAGCCKALTEIREAGHRVIIYSCRLNGLGGQSVLSALNEMLEWLEKHKVPYDEIYVGEGKPMGCLYIDDNGLRFDGNWSHAMRDIRWILWKKTQ